MKAPRPEPERTPTPKRPMEAQNAKEVAKKLLKSGAITAIPRTPKRPEHAGFKRPRGLERKLSGTDRTVSGYQPFSATQLDDQETESLRPRVNVSINSQQWEQANVSTEQARANTYHQVNVKPSTCTVMQKKRSWEIVDIQLINYCCNFEETAVSIWVTFFYTPPSNLGRLWKIKVNARINSSSAKANYCIVYFDNVAS